MLAGCSRSELRQDPLEIELRPVTGIDTGDLFDDSEPGTKADPELNGTTLGTDNSYLIYLSASCEQNPRFLADQLFSYTAAGKWEASSAVGEADPVYWIPTQTMDFLGLACTTAAKTALASNFSWSAGKSSDGFTITGWDTWANQYDIMYAYANGLTQDVNSGVVDLDFKHACALLSFTAKSSMADIVKIHSITINNLGYLGTFTVDNSRIDIEAGWGPLTAADKRVYNIDGTDSDYNFDVPTTATKFARNLLVPQQASKTITMTYTLPNAATLDLQIPLPKTTWKAGYKYTYALEFTTTEIFITEQVVDWDDSSVPEVTVN